MAGRIRVAALVGNLLREEGGAQQLLYDVFSSLPCEFRPTVYYMFGEATFRDDFENAEISVLGIDAESKYDLRAFRRLVELLRRDPPDVLQTNSTVSGPWGRVAARLAGVPRVISVEHTTHGDLRPFARIVNGLTLPLSDDVVGVSSAVVDSLRGWERLLLASRTEIHTIHNGVDVEHFSPPVDRESTVPSPPLVGTVGRLVPAKGYDHLLRAWPRVLDAVPEARLGIAGDGPLRTELEELASDLDVSATVTFTGYRSDPRPVYRRLDVAVFPSVREGFGLTTAQAMATGVPVIASDLPALRTVVGDAGLTVPRENPNALADAIVGLLTSSERRAELGAAGRRRIESRFPIEPTVREYAALYRGDTDD